MNRLTSIPSYKFKVLTILCSLFIPLACSGISAEEAALPEDHDAWAAYSEMIRGQISNTKKSGAVVGDGYEECMAFMIVFQKTFPTLTLPYTGVSVFKVKHENVEAFVNNLRYQSTYTVELGADLIAFTRREHADYTTFLWGWHYPVTWKGFADATSDEQAKKKTEEIALKYWPQMCTYLESYDWYTYRHEANPVPESVSSVPRLIPLDPHCELIEDPERGECRK